FNQSAARLLHSSSIAEHVQFRSQLEAGWQPGPVSRLLDTINELFLLAPGPPPSGMGLSTPKVSIYVWHPVEGKIEVLPQEWFTANEMDLGYQWITRVTRDPETGHIVGGGI